MLGIYIYTYKICIQINSTVCFSSLSVVAAVQYSHHTGLPMVAGGGGAHHAVFGGQQQDLLAGVHQEVHLPQLLCLSFSSEV